MGASSYRRNGSRIPHTVMVFLRIKEANRRQRRRQKHTKISLSYDLSLRLDFPSPPTPFSPSFVPHHIRFLNIHKNVAWLFFSLLFLIDFFFLLFSI